MKNPIKSLSIRFLLSLALALTAVGNSLAAEQDGAWVASWGASPFAFVTFGDDQPPGPYKNQTVRQIVRLSVGGDQLRLRLSNESGTEAVTIDAVSVAVREAGVAVKADSIRTVTFGGSESVTLAAGAPAVSDAIDLAVKPLTELAVSFYFAGETPATTVHMGRIAYVSGEGNFTQQENMSGAETSTNLVFLSGVYVQRQRGTNVVVTLGDSITDGAASTPFTFNSWPDHLTQRLHDAGIDNVAIVNQGISGNQVLRNGAGISALARFDRDVLSTPGLTHIILLEGINDIGSGGMTFPGTQGPGAPMRSAQEIIAGYQQLINRAHSQSPPVTIYGATLTPFEGTFEGYYSPEKDEIRREVNAWIRSSGAFDGVIDFDKAVQDPDNPNKIKEEYDSGDKLHPGDKGYKKMADSIDLEWFKD